MPLYRCPSSLLINPIYVEVITPIQKVEPNSENGYTKTMYEFSVRTMSGFMIGFSEEMQDIADNIRRDIIQAVNNP